MAFGDGTKTEFLFQSGSVVLKRNGYASKVMSSIIPYNQ
jgi:hypothetical protein